MTGDWSSVKKRTGDNRVKRTLTNISIRQGHAVPRKIDHFGLICKMEVIKSRPFELLRTVSITADFLSGERTAVGVEYARQTTGVLAHTLAARVRRTRIDDIIDA